MERPRQSDGSALATELLASADSGLFRSGAVWMGFSLGLWSVRPVRMRCLRLRSSPRLRSSTRLCRATGLCWASALLPSVVNPKRNGLRRLVLKAASQTLLLLAPHLWFFSTHTACFLAVGLILCVQNPGKGRGGESGCNGQANERQTEVSSWGMPPCGWIRIGSNVEPSSFVHLVKNA